MKDNDIDSFLEKSFSMFSNKKKSDNKKQKLSINYDKNSNSEIILDNKIDNTIYNPLLINALGNDNKKVEDIIKPLYPNEQVFQSEYNDQKNFVLDKYIKAKPPQPKKTKKQNYTRKIISNLKKENLIYDSFLEMNKIWNEYMDNLMNKTLNTETISAKLLKCDLHGAIIEVLTSSNKNTIGIKGIVLYESRKTFNILTQSNKIKTIMKKGTIFSIHLSNQNINIKIIGDNFIFKSAERTKAKFKTKYNLNIILNNI